MLAKRIAQSLLKGQKKDESCWGCGMDWKSNKEQRDIVRDSGLIPTTHPETGEEIKVCPACYEDIRPEGE